MFTDQQEAVDLLPDQHDAEHDVHPRLQRQGFPDVVATPWAFSGPELAVRSADDGQL